MAVSEKDFRDLSSSLAEIRGVFKIVGSLAGAALLAALGWCYHLGTKVSAIEQQLADGGNTKIVAELNKPASAQQLRANLSTVIAQVQTAQANQTKPNPKKVVALSSALSNVVAADSGLPEAWRAAAQMISYRSSESAIPQNLAPVCGQDGNVPKLVFTGGPHGADVVATITFTSCNLYLDRPDFFNVGKATMQQSNEEVTNWHLMLRCVFVHYGGGPLSKISQITFDHCVFDFQLDAAPPNRGKRLTETLLATEDFDMVFADIDSNRS